MYVLVCYDAAFGRTEVFRKLLSRFLTHEQNSVFAGNLSGTKLEKLKKQLEGVAVEEDSIILISAENRHNVEVTKLRKSENGVLAEEGHSHHRMSSLVL